MRLNIRIAIAAFLLASAVVYGGSAFAQYPGFDAPSLRSGGGGSGGFVPVLPKIDGGEIPIGATAQVVVRFRNEGAQPIEAGQINLYPSSTVSANVSLNQCAKEALAPEAECAIAISVKGLQAGSWRVEMLMLHSGRTRLVTATMAGTVEASDDMSKNLSSDIEAIPDKLDFGSLGSSQTLVEPVILRNITSNTLTIEGIDVNAGERSGYSVTSDCKELQAGQACIAVVTWAPTQRGPSTGGLVINHSGPSAVSTISLNGDYSPDAVAQAEVFPNAIPGKGLLVSSQDGFDFGSGVSSASTITVSLVNVGDADLGIGDIRLSGSDNGLSMGSTGCSKGLILKPVEACPLTLTWSPTRVGALLDDVQIIHDGARGVLVLPIRGVSEDVVSQDQKAIVLSQAPTQVINQPDVMESKPEPKKVEPEPKPVDEAATEQVKANINAAAALDGLKITSFSPARAIVNGPGGSRLIHNKEQIMLGGIVWDVNIQKNGIEFTSGADRVLLLFDRSLSSINRIQGKSSSQDKKADSDVKAAKPVEAPKPVPTEKETTTSNDKKTAAVDPKT